jgi:hypothetical protein
MSPASDVPSLVAAIAQVGQSVPDRRKSRSTGSKASAGGLFVISFFGLTRHWHAVGFGGPRRTRPTPPRDITLTRQWESRRYH